MSLSVIDFIQRLEALHQRDETISNNIASYSELLKALRDLDALVGMSTAKSSIILQLKALIVKCLEGQSGMNVFDDQMLHTVITGPPGVGKTQLGKFLARIWQSLGILKAKPKEPLDDDFYTIYRYALRKSQESLIKPLETLNSIAKDLTALSYQRGRGTLREYADELFTIRDEVQDMMEEITLTNRNREGNLPPVPFKVVSRVDFVAGYVGQTAIKTEKLLKGSLGGVVFIDEAYSLIHDDKDNFGMEALTTLNQFMSEHPNEIIIIFAGYKDLMDKGIFSKQPGLKSRCSWYIDVPGYTGEDLAKIFSYQLQEHDWSVSSTVNLASFFQRHLKDFPDYGRNTSKFLFYCKLYHMDAEFIKITGSKKRRAKSTTVITEQTLELAFKRYQENHVGEIKETPPPFGLYT